MPTCVPSAINVALVSGIVILPMPHLSPTECYGADAVEARETDVVLFVDDDAAPNGDGLSWATALRYLQDALAFAAVPTNEVTEIHLAQGTYMPDQGGGQIFGDTNATFLIPGTIALLGGYAGLTGDDLAIGSCTKPLSAATFSAMTARSVPGRTTPTTRCISPPSTMRKRRV